MDGMFGAYGAREIDRRWLWTLRVVAAFLTAKRPALTIAVVRAVRLCAAASIALLLSPLWWNARATWEMGYLGYLWSMLWQLAGVLLNAVVLWSLRSRTGETQRKTRGALVVGAWFFHRKSF